MAFGVFGEYRLVWASNNECVQKANTTKFCQRYTWECPHNSGWWPMLTKVCAFRVKPLWRMWKCARFGPSYPEYQKACSVANCHVFYQETPERILDLVLSDGNAFSPTSTVFCDIILMRNWTPKKRTASHTYICMQLISVVRFYFQSLDCD